MESLPTAVVSGIRYFDRGASDGKLPCVLIHGLGNSLDFWTAVAPLLSEDRRVIAMDLPGFGDSSVPEAGFTLETIVEGLSRFLDHRDVGEFILVGHSLGGIVALRLAGLDTRVQRIGLVDANLLGAAEVLQNGREALVHPRLAAAVLSQFIGGLIPFNATTARMFSRTGLLRRITLWPFVYSSRQIDDELLSVALSHNGGLSALRVLAAVQSIALPDLMKAVLKPTDLVWGAEDRLLTAEDLRRTREIMAVQQELAIPHCGHWPMLEKPEILAEFIRGL